MSNTDNGKLEAYQDMFNPDGHYPENPRCKCAMCFIRKYSYGERPVQLSAYQERLLRFMADNQTGRLNVIQRPRETMRFNAEAAEQFFRTWQAQFPELAEAAHRITSRAPNMQVLPDYQDIEHRIVADMIIDDPALDKIEALAVMYGRNSNGTRRAKRRARKARNKGGR